jgi:bacteriorhodopsin
MSLKYPNEIDKGPPPPQNAVIDIEKKPKPEKEGVQYYVKFSFTITYILLLTTATITFVEAMRTKSQRVRHILNLETCISVVAGYFYSVFVAQIDKYNYEKKAIDWKEITKTRYIDWAITTPMMLLALCLVLANECGKSVQFSLYGIILVLNYIMLFMGYLGETGDLSRITADVAGFFAFGAMFYIIYRNFVAPASKITNLVLFMIYFVIWTFYGIVYMLEESLKNIAMNILDLTAKCLVGLGLWAYYTKILLL